MLRPNPTIDAGVTASALGGGEIHWFDADIVARLALDVEVARTSFDNVAGVTPPSHLFAQATLDGAITYRTFRTQSIRFHGHAVATTHGHTPRQRWAYLGGTGTLPPLERLALGGDQLLFLDGRYIFPISRFTLPVVGAPTIALRDEIGGAAAGKFPSLHQAVGLQLSLGPVYVEVAIDPATRKRHSGFGLSVFR